MLVWGVDLVIFYGFNSPTFGEPWTNYSYLQVCQRAAVVHCSQCSD
jgi:hypothetical protein